MSRYILLAGSTDKGTPAALYTAAGEFQSAWRWNGQNNYPGAETVVVKGVRFEPTALGAPDARLDGWPRRLSLEALSRGEAKAASARKRSDEDLLG